MHFHIVVMSIFAWGMGKTGQLGQGTKQNSNLPVQILLAGNRRTNRACKANAHLSHTSEPSCFEPINYKAIEITAGGLMTGFVLENGDAFFCGCGTHGRLGTGNEDNCLTPVKVEIPGNFEIVKVRSD